MSNITGGFTGGLSPDAVKVGIEEVMYETYQREQQPAYLSCRDSIFFKNSTTNKEAFVWDEDSNVGMFEEIGEQQEINTTDTFIGNKTTVYIKKYMKSIPISHEAFITDQVGKREAIGKQVGDRARLTQDNNAILNTYGDAFSGSINTTPDGDAMASDSHTTLTGANVDNLETGSLTPDNLWTAVVSLQNQKAQDGEWGAYMFEGLAIPFVLYKTAKEILGSTLAANSAENNLNIFETDYGQVSIKASGILGSTYNSYTNANTAYHLISSNSKIIRKVLTELNTNLIPPENSRTDSWEHRSRYEDVVFFGSWCGYVGSTGAA